MTCKPILKWVGGKTQILDEVFNEFPCSIRNYYEPFVGGGSVLLRFLEKVQAKRIRVSGEIHASDLNSALIQLYIDIRDNPDPLIAEILKLKRGYESAKDSSVYYYKKRDAFNKNTCTPLRRSALFVFLNKTGFRGMYREGPNGFNVPHGNYSSPEIIDPVHVRAVSALIKPVIFTCEPFQDVLKRPMSRDDFVYADPPYYGTFVGYTTSGFGQKVHDELFELLHSTEGSWVMSNSDHPYVRAQFESKIIRTVECRRRINSKKPESTANELIVTSNVRIEVEN